MSLQPKTYFTPEEYLELERKADYKSEYLNGEIYAMGGASPHHVLIVTNIVSELRNQLKNGSLVIRVARIFLIYMKIIQLVVTA